MPQLLAEKNARFMDFLSLLPQSHQRRVFDLYPAVRIALPASILVLLDFNQTLPQSDDLLLVDAIHADTVVGDKSLAIDGIPAVFCSTEIIMYRFADLLDHLVEQCSGACGALNYHKILAKSLPHFDSIC